MSCSGCPSARGSEIGSRSRDSGLASPARRRALRLGLAFGFAGFAVAGLAVPGLAVPGAAAAGPSILVVSRKRLLNDTDHARALLEAEQRLTAALQDRIDHTKAELTAEEEELARLRTTLEREEFENRTTAFDRRVRRERREAQRMAAALQNAFRVERLRLVEALDALLEEIRRDRGASVILGEDQVMAADPAIDITAEVLVRFNASVPPPEIPSLESIVAGVAEGGEQP